MASYMLKHDGKLNRWCPVQEDVEEYFRKTLEEVCAARLASPTPTRARVVLALARETHGACSARPHPPLRTVPPSRGLGEVSPAGPPACLTGARLAPHDRLCCVLCGCLQRHVQPLLQSNLELADLRVVTVPFAIFLQRIMVIDGAMGTVIQQYKLQVRMRCCHC